MKVSIDFELNWNKAFEILCETLHMRELIDKENPCIYKGRVCEQIGDKYKIVSDYPDLFAALRNVANAMIPNCDFRGDDYITDYGYEKDEVDLTEDEIYVEDEDDDEF